MSLQIGKIKGIPVKLHFTLFLVSALVVWTLATMLMPEIYPGLNTTAYWSMGVVGATVLFVSVLLHELAHSIVALRYGLNVREIVLCIFGGVSVIEDQEVAYKDFHKEFKIAVVGPIISFVIAAILASLWVLMFMTLEFPEKTHNVSAILAAGILQYGALVNVVLGGINLIPASPLDGGRILRSALLRSNNDYYKSTKIATRIGIVISYGLIGLGFLVMTSGSFISGIRLLLMGWFLNRAARSFLRQHTDSHADPPIPHPKGPLMSATISGCMFHIPSMFCNCSSYIIARTFTAHHRPPLRSLPEFNQKPD